MKTFLYIIVLVGLTQVAVLAQTMNWKNFEEKHVFSLNTGLEYGYTIGIGYGQKLNTRKPVLLDIEYSFPTGSQLFDDFKVKWGGQSEVARFKNWSFTIKAHAIFRRYENSMAVLSNFGSEFSTLLGYAKPRWQVMGEFGFDKAITTHIKNKDVLKNFYPGVTDGWYIPTAGNFFYGLQAGYSFRRQDLYLRAGKIIGQDWKTQPNFPIYLKLGFNYRF